MTTWWSQTCEHLQEPHGASCPLIIVTRTGPGLSFPDCVMIFASRFEKRMKELCEANWWIRAPLRKDGDVSPDTDYVPDTFVHMPHLRFGKGSIYCPRCERADRVTPKQIPTHKCPIRRVCGMEHFYGVLECRYTCGHCHDAYTAAKEEARAQSGGGAVQRADIDAEPFTFMPHADFTLAMLEYNQPGLSISSFAQ